MTACGLLQFATALVVGAAVLVWLASVAVYFSLLRRLRGQRASLIFSSMWLLKAGSLGTEAEPLRRRLVALFVLFMAAIVAAIVIATATPVACPAA
jgi:hypothetical protein